ncbi:MAG TPA: hypothetical protein VER11_31050 [Polyangiaceae bacterium]|nr:hypothetical protein [Polyangiaceae bacterium]
MVVFVRGRWWALLLGLALSACETVGSSAEPNSSDPTRASFAGRSSVQGCFVGSPCRCDNGHDGYYTECVPTKSCSCESCPEFQPSAVPEFRTCSGDVLGDWSLESAELNLEPLQFRGEFGSVASCTAQAVDMRSFRLKLSILGDNRAALDMSELSYGVRFSEACSKPNGRCTDYLLDHGEGPCKALGCGVCECGSTAFGADYDESLHVQVREQTLTFVNNTSTVAEFKYCVEGDRLVLNTHGLTATLRRSLFGGMPSSCESRDESSCESGAFCNWGSSGCTGSAPTRCLLPDFGVVPGCEVYAPDAACSAVNAPMNCADLDRAECDATAGCEWWTACAGPAIDCNELWLRSGICDVDGGCQKVSAEECTGTAECERHSTQVHCQELNQCTWVDRCVGAEEVPCDEYPVSECIKHKRCEIVGEPLQ